MTCSYEAGLHVGRYSRRSTLALLSAFTISPATIALGADIEMPDFPAQPPYRSSLAPIPIDFSKVAPKSPANAALWQIEDRLIEHDYPYYWFRWVDGIVLVTKPERIHDDGSSWKDQRFRPDVYLKYKPFLFGVDRLYERRARAFAFIVTAQQISFGKPPTSYAEHAKALKSGWKLPLTGLELPALSVHHRIIAVVWEFADDSNRALSFIAGRLDAKTHLQKAGIIDFNRP
jgi:hypothetical protein